MYLKIHVPSNALKKFVDLPEDAEIVEIKQETEDRITGFFQMVVTCPKYVGSRGQDIYLNQDCTLPKWAENVVLAESIYGQDSGEKNGKNDGNESGN